MVTKQTDILTLTEEGAEQGKGMLTLRKMSAIEGFPAKVRTFARAELEPGASVGYHVHTGECECYYILSGSGTYSDNGTLVPISAGDFTFTPSGEGHGIENTGSEPLAFIALIVLN